MSTDENIMIGSRIRELRKKKKLSMKRLGELVNLHESTVSRYEQGDIKSLDIDKIKEFANVLDVEPKELLGWNTSLKPNEYQKIWENEMKGVVFSADEIYELIEFAKFLLSKRK